MVKDTFKKRFTSSLNNILVSDKNKCYFKNNLSYFVTNNKDRYLNSYHKFFFAKFLDKYDLEAVDFFLKDDSDRNEFIAFVKDVVNSIDISDEIYSKYIKSLEMNDEE